MQRAWSRIHLRACEVSCADSHERSKSTHETQPRSGQLMGQDDIRALKFLRVSIHHHWMRRHFAGFSGTDTHGGFFIWLYSDSDPKHREKLGQRDSSTNCRSRKPLGRDAPRYQLPRSPKRSMTERIRSAPFFQLFARARSAALALPLPIAAIISSCSETERWSSWTMVCA